MAFSFSFQKYSVNASACNGCCLTKYIQVVAFLVMVWFFWEKNMVTVFYCYSNAYFNVQTIISEYKFSNPGLNRNLSLNGLFESKMKQYSCQSII